MPAERRSRDGTNDGTDMGHVGAGAAVIATAVAVALLGAWGLIASLGGTLHDPAIHPAPLPAPVLEQHPLDDRRAHDLEQRQKLSHYGWVDRDKGVVHIPIDVAMTLISRRASVGGSPGGSPGAPRSGPPTNETSP